MDGVFLALGGGGGGGGIGGGSVLEEVSVENDVVSCRVSSAPVRIGSTSFPEEDGCVTLRVVYVFVTRAAASPMVLFGL